MRHLLTAEFLPFGKRLSFNDAEVSQSKPINYTDDGRPPALQRRLLPLALPPIGTRSSHILAGIPWLYLRTHLEIMAGASQIRHPVHHWNFLSVSQKHSHESYCVCFANMSQQSKSSVTLLEPPPTETLQAFFGTLCRTFSPCSDRL